MERLVIDILFVFVLLDKQMALYPSGHSIVEAASHQLMDQLKRYFQTHTALDLHVVKDTIRVNSHLIYQKNSRLQEFAQMFSHRGFVSVNVTKGVAVTDLMKFFQLTHSGLQRAVFNLNLREY